MAAHTHAVMYEECKEELSKLEATLAQDAWRYEPVDKLLGLR